ncbi:MAG: SPOR domain-containing protein [Amoebophilaceae bacterium]|jgi:hypothetical protein|nr:SPOR domain-containing protein [Amoebophilaceae bacterium]
MLVETDQSKQEENKDFGLPQAEFKPIEAGGGKWLRITTVLAGLVLIMGVGVVYWFFYRASSSDPTSKAYPTHELYKDGVPKANVDSFNGGVPAQHQTVACDEALSHSASESETPVEEAHIEDVNASPCTVKPRGGTITSINTSRGHYYVVVGSFIDDDLASDYANRLAQQGVDVTLIAPPQGQYYFRVAIAQRSTLHDAHEKLESLKATYGAGIWVLKY